MRIFLLFSHMNKKNLKIQLKYNINLFIYIFILQYSENNIITQKIKTKKKDVKITIKVTKNNSLIGLTEFLIPIQAIQKH